MSASRYLGAAVASAALLLALPAFAKSKCPAGETSSHGKCVKSCPTEGAFGDPDRCECPAGYGKLLLGNGSGQCDRLRCPSGAVIAADKACDCAAGFEKVAVKKGKVRCEARQAAAQ